LTVATTSPKFFSLSLFVVFGAGYDVRIRIFAENAPKILKKSAKT
jgi:hypothetical protein